MRIDLKLLQSLTQFLFRFCGASGNLRIGDNIQINFTNSITKRKITLLWNTAAMTVQCHRK